MLLEISNNQHAKHGERRRARVKALIIGANVGCVIATIALAVLASVVGIFTGDIGEGLVLLILYLFNGLLISAVSVNALVWLVLVPFYSKSYKMLSLMQAVVIGLVFGPAYVLFLVFAMSPASFGRDIGDLLTLCAIGILYGVTVAYWCVRVEQRNVGAAQQNWNSAG